MLVSSYKTQAEIPEGLKEHYREQDGLWVVDGFVSKSKLDEFRSNNRSLSKEKEELQVQLLKFKDIDPVKYAEAVEKMQQFENDQLEKAGEFGALRAKIEQRAADELKIEREKAKVIQDGWNKEKISSQTAMLVLKHAVPEEGNMRYIQRDIAEIATIDPETNQIVFLDENGIKIRNEAGDGALGLEEFITKSYIPKSNLFVKSQGGGARGGNVPMLTKGTVQVENISGQDISGGMLEKLASGEVQAVD